MVVNVVGPRGLGVVTARWRKVLGLSVTPDDSRRVRTTPEAAALPAVPERFKQQSGLGQGVCAELCSLGLWGERAQVVDELLASVVEADRAVHHYVPPPELPRMPSALLE
eukprot:CAMPEP_0119303958 /NCGR_PEP_ID=MMETSP1333-20130426/5295_1 /TAXON_ID=418940 /ORGANISM="Scyphosphaera apsteinii, Strain RCC1455" /LENGTH=109 /DNA_ID=CAMNT_0007306745 /DNA_START=1451 /DNA_END=1780 /DNA_ORIENTATION=+